MVVRVYGRNPKDLNVDELLFLGKKRISKNLNEQFLLYTIEKFFDFSVEVCKTKQEHVFKVYDWYGNTVGYAIIGK